MNQVRKGQKLPNECILMVIENFHDDPKTLQKLLLVNKFCFKVVVPLLYYNPLKDWADHGNFEPDSNNIGLALRPEKFAALMLASIIHSQRAAANPTRVITKLKPMPAFDVNKFLDKYGLQLPDKIESPLIQDAVRGVSRTTIDYSKHIALPQNWEGDTYSFNGVIRLTSFPELWDRAHPLKHNTADYLWARYYPDDGLDSDDEHTPQLQCHRDYVNNIRKRLSNLLLQCSPNSIEIITNTDLSDDQFMPPADRCYRLKTVKLEWSSIIDQKRIDRVIAFIKAIQAAFPEKKKSLQIKFRDDDKFCFRDGYDSNSRSGSPAAVAWRKGNQEREQYRVLIYEALGNPTEMTASASPDFYDATGNIELDSLIKFTDRDSYRFLYGDGPKQAAFLQRCDNLKFLELSVHHPDSFSWALKRDATGGTARHSGNFLRNMEQLKINMDTSLTVVHDTVAAFGEYLQRLEVNGRASFHGILPETLLDPRLLRHTKIGEWNLPCLKSLRLQFDAESGIYLGRLDECPNLETLYINIRYILPWTDRGRGRVYFANPVFPSPVWKLPRLRFLTLYCKAAMAFDFDSLAHMPALIELVMIVNRKDDQPIPIASVPRLQAYRCSQYTPDSTIPVPLGLWRDQWSLPWLKTLHLEGPPSSVFCFKWLTSCPSLQSIKLITGVPFQRLPLLSSSSNSTLLPIEIVYEDATPLAGFGDVDDSGFEPGMTPLMESRLTEIELRGPWVMSMYDLTKVLTVYAPNLVTLKMDRVTRLNWLWQGNEFLRTVVQATGLGSDSCKLKSIVAEYTVGTQLVQANGLVAVGDRAECLYQYHESRIPMFMFGGTGFVRQQDWL
ncbi:hypothetical protein BGZ52_010513 [Haplosporangium bisporale]|nr:hypothetical protein BGZ52_010513 [Haplosporangium bisporale]